MLMFICQGGELPYSWRQRPGVVRVDGIVVAVVRGRFGEGQAAVFPVVGFAVAITIVSIEYFITIECDAAALIMAVVRAVFRPDAH